MKPAIKTLWLVIAFMFAFGLILAGVGLLAGAAHRPLYFERGRRTKGDYRDDVHESLRNTEPITDIDIEVAQADIQFITSDTYGYDIDLKDQWPVNIKFASGKLSVSQRPALLSLGITPDLGFGAIKIYLPADARLGDVDISTASGDISIEALEVNRLTLDLVSGTLTSHDTTCAALRLNVVSAQVDYTGDVTEAMELDGVSGDMRFTLARPASNYRADCNMVSGDVSINGTRVATKEGTIGTGNTTIEINSVSGDYDLNFTGQ
jgi:DUF4097 and DUF4098 domain-containing protein YvlB